jgi:hypothetical protein
MSFVTEATSDGRLQWGGVQVGISRSYFGDAEP